MVQKGLHALQRYSENAKRKYSARQTRQPDGRDVR